MGPLAFPVNSDFAATMNYRILKLLNAGVWEELKDKYEPPQACGDHRLDEAAIIEESEDDAQLKPDNFIGLFLIVSLGMGSALVINLCTGTFRRVSRLSQSKESSLEVGQSSPSADEDVAQPQTTQKL